jgi:hypothetical protein
MAKKPKRKNVARAKSGESRRKSEKEKQSKEK